MKTNSNDHLFHFLIRVSKHDSAFTYFLLESSEGLAFYSTIDSLPGQSYRDIDIKGDIRLEREVLQLIESLKRKFPLTILFKKYITN